MNPIDFKYIGFVSSRLERFKVKKNTPYEANFRCPLCGDSKKSSTKARGFLLESKNAAVFYCHNCYVSLPLPALLRKIDVGLYKEYNIERKLNSLGGPQHLEQPTIDHFQETKPKISNPLKGLKKISQLPVNHPAKKYIVARKIPPHTHHRLYYAPKFSKWINTLIPERLPAKIDEPRLVLPLIDTDGKVFGVQGRSFKKSSGLRYISIMFEEKDKVFGQETVDFSEDYIMVECPIDSLFLTNSLAMSGADANIPHPEKAIVAYDNEPRNPQIVRRMEKALDAGLRVCIWPKSIESGDINDMVLNENMSPSEIERIIHSNARVGLAGKFELSVWQK